ncbi:hypothetical protein KUTeg_005689 [Tegillarca granosa]|uniref:Uncharacterized protein n=1 Tax=Tegillarca granosa TaxID=220873 RepID=A0ABQ9FHE9_TEGGR|nr:hypothetical protein KUTeg_005689 [Tegillarca granosa]
MKEKKKLCLTRNFKIPGTFWQVNKKFERSGEGKSTTQSGPTDRR